MRVEPYKVKGTQFSLKTGGVDIHHVHDIPQAANGSTLVQALTAADGSVPFKMPKKGQIHPTAKGFICDDVIAREFMGAPTKAIVQVIWKAVEPGGDDQIPGSSRPTILRITNSGRTTTTHFDADGKAIKVDYDPTGAAGNLNVSASAPPNGTKRYAPLAPIFEPGDIVEIERSELKSPWPLRKLYRRKLNSDRIWGEAPRRFLMIGISGVAEVFGIGDALAKPRLWRNTYTMEFRPPAPEGEGWDFTAAYIDSKTGQRPANVDPVNREFAGDGDVVGGNGWKRFRLYKTAAFAPLRLPDIRI